MQVEQNFSDEKVQTIDIIDSYFEFGDRQVDKTCGGEGGRSE